MSEEERKDLSNYLENYGAYDLADEFNTQVYMVNTQEYNDLVLLYYFRQKDEIEQLQQENQQLKKDYQVLRTTNISLNDLVNSCQYEIRKYKSVIDEVREKTENYATELYNKTNSSKTFSQKMKLIYIIREILDKVKGEDTND